MDGNDSHVTWWVHLMPLNCIPKNDYYGKFCVVYFTTQKKKNWKEHTHAYTCTQRYKEQHNKCSAPISGLMSSVSGKWYVSDESRISWLPGLFSDTVLTHEEHAYKADL